MSRGRLDEKVCYYTPYAKGQQAWTQNDAKESGFPVRSLVYVTDHTYESNGRMSNFVTFVRVNRNGYLETETHGTYDFGQFKIATNKKLVRLVLDK